MSKALCLWFDSLNIPFEFQVALKPKVVRFSKSAKVAFRAPFYTLYFANDKIYGIPNVFQ